MLSAAAANGRCRPSHHRGFFVFSPTRLAVRRGLSTAALASALIVMPAAASAAQKVDATVRFACEAATKGTAIPRTLDVRVFGTVPDSTSPGGQFTLDDLRTEFAFDPDVIRPQVVRVVGRVTPTVTNLAVTATGATPSRVSVVSPKAPLALDPVDVRTDIGVRFPVPQKGTFGPVGPFTTNAMALARSVSLGLDTIGLSVVVTPRLGVPIIPVPRPVQIKCAPKGGTFARIPVRALPPTKLPIITGLKPSSGPAGTNVVIHGERLLGVTGVSFDGTPVPFKLGSDTELQAIAPTINWIVSPGPEVLMDVAVTTDAGSSENTKADDFVYLTGAGPILR